MKRNHIPHNNCAEILKLAIDAKSIADAQSEVTLVELSDRLNVTLESICFAVVRHWKWDEKTGYANPVEIINAKKESE